MNEFSVSDAVAHLNLLGFECELVGRSNWVISSVRPIDEATENSFGYVRDMSYVSTSTKRSFVGTVIVPREALSLLDFNKSVATLIGVDQPEAAFYTVLQWCTSSNGAALLHTQAVVESGAIIGSAVSVGPFTYIASDVVIGNNVDIGSGCSLKRCTIADGVVIHDGVRIGGDALGSTKDHLGKWVDRPSLSRVRVGSNTRIEENTVIQSGFMRDTNVEENVRIGPNTCIGNGTRVGSGTLIAQGVVIAGSVDIGEDCEIWGRVSVREGQRIGAGSTVGMGAVVLKDLEGNRIYVGIPAREIQTAHLSESMDQD